MKRSTAVLFGCFAMMATTNSLVFQALVSWTNDGPATYAPTIVLTGTLTTP